MSQAETARAVYGSVKAEVMERIKLRDQALFIFLGAVGTVAGIALGTPARLNLLLLLPYLGFGAAVIVSQHHALIGALEQFVVRELQPFLVECDEAARNWEDSASFHEYLSETTWKRAASHWVLIGIPPILGEAMIWQVGVGESLRLKILWWLGALVSVVAIGIMARASYFRHKILDRCQWRTFN